MRRPRAASAPREASAARVLRGGARRGRHGDAQQSAQRPPRRWRNRRTLCQAHARQEQDGGAGAGAPCLRCRSRQPRCGALDELRPPLGFHALLRRLLRAGRRRSLAAHGLQQRRVCVSVLCHRCRAAPPAAPLRTRVCHCTAAAQRLTLHARHHAPLAPADHGGADRARGAHDGRAGDQGTPSKGTRPHPLRTTGMFLPARMFGLRCPVLARRSRTPRSLRITGCRSGRSSRTRSVAFAGTRLSGLSTRRGRSCRATCPARAACGSARWT